MLAVPLIFNEKDEPCSPSTRSVRGNCHSNDDPPFGRAGLIFRRGETEGQLLARVVDMEENCARASVSSALEPCWRRRSRTKSAIRSR